jgi:hypothetical protein
MNVVSGNSRVVLMAAILLATTADLSAQPTKAVESSWVKMDSRGKLIYKTTDRGDRIMDFSYAGYGGGGVKIPEVKTKVVVHPVRGDNTLNVQRAIDSVSGLPLVNGFRGAVQLAPGDYSCDETIRLAASGVVLRGEGNKSRIIMTGKPHVCFMVSGAGRTKTIGRAVMILDAYVPSGADVVTVTDAGSLKVGDEIAVTKPITPEWVHFMGMDSLVRDGKKQTWITGDLTTERTVRAIRGNQISLDVPLTDSYDARFTRPGTTVQKIEREGELQQVGLENFVIIAPEQSVTISQEHHSAIRTRGVADAWIRNISISNTVNSIGISGRRVTVEKVDIQHTLPTIGAAKPADLSANGSQLLFNKCSIRGDNVFYLATGAKVSGPNVMLNCNFQGGGWIQPHQRWSTGLLIDGCQVPGGGIDFMNRGEMGSGHGWSIGWAVAWNCIAKTFLNQQPPGAYNWVIGCTGEKQQRAMPFDKEPMLPEGVYDAYQTRVQPTSLYLQQLAERKGRTAVENIGYYL